MLARTLCFALSGTEGEPVTIETYVSPSAQFQFTMVGLPDLAVKESRERVMAAFRNSGFMMPLGHTTVNLSPADLRKEGTAFDLAIAMGVLMASGQAHMADHQPCLLLGELALDGRLSPVQGALSMVIAAFERGIRQVILPVANAEEVVTIQGMQVYPAHNLYEVMQHMAGQALLTAQQQRSYEELLAQHPVEHDIAQVRGQNAARRALEVAAAGGHNLLMIGVPGSGKTMLARCLPGILPAMSREEAYETTRIYGISGLVKPGSGLLTQRPFRSPHHTASAAAMVGGGANARPGEVSLAHNGVLFLDELPEYPRQVLESLRQPLEDGLSTVSRVKAHSQYLSRCMLVASMNPCPCGYYGSQTKACRCGQFEIRKYLDKISGPLLDRIDIQIEVDAVPVDEIAAVSSQEDSLTVRARVEGARRRQQTRFKRAGIRTNAQMTMKHIENLAQLTPDAQKLLTKAIDQYGFSMRTYGRLIKVARTIADLAGSEAIEVAAMAEAIQYRMLDAKYWGIARA